MYFVSMGSFAAETSITINRTSRNVESTNLRIASVPAKAMAGNPAKGQVANSPAKERFLVFLIPPLSQT
jgi:hypothetical protein